MINTPERERTVNPIQNILTPYITHTNPHPPIPLTSLTAFSAAASVTTYAAGSLHVCSLSQRSTVPSHRHCASPHQTVDTWDSPHLHETTAAPPAPHSTAALI